ncbi:MAG TPA: sigma-70 family RNA polymerase sigma factor [Actinomycetales bacterium]|nr:sigma-70 family RNA polymerase sigma factor [Actinomycetales bacterium]
MRSVVSDLRQGSTPATTSRRTSATRSADALPTITYEDRHDGARPQPRRDGGDRRKVSRPADAPVLTDEQRALVREHLPVVGYLVSEIITRVPPQVQRDDLTSAGQLALVLASRSYDPTTGVPFGHYARTRIRGALLDELRAADWASRGARSRAKKLAQAEERLAAELGRWPSDAELAEELKADRASIPAVRHDAHRSVVLSLDQLVEVTGGAEDHVDADDHQPDPAQSLLVSERMKYLKAAVEALPDRLRLVVEHYFLGERPMTEIAKELGVTESRVSQLRAEALVLLRDGLNTHLDPGKVAPVDRPDGVVARRRSAYYAQVAALAAQPAMARTTTLPRPDVSRTA